MTSKEIRAAREVMPRLGRKSRADLCSVIPAARKQLNEKGRRAFARDDPDAAGAIANEAAYLKRWQKLCRRGGLDLRRSRVDDY